LLQRYRGAGLVALDLAPAMLKATRARRPWLRRLDAVCADAAALPLADQSVDLVFSNLMLQWCNEPDRCIRGVPPGAAAGRAAAVQHLRAGHTQGAACRLARGRRTHHVSRFIDMHDLGDALVRAGLGEPVMDMELVTLTYPDVRSLMRDLKTMGAHNATAGRSRGLTGRRAWPPWRPNTSSGALRTGACPLPGRSCMATPGRAKARPAAAGSDAGGETRVPLDQLGRRR
jgi:malonyl-CoA O-methyltransferase